MATGDYYYQRIGTYRPTGRDTQEPGTNVLDNFRAIQIKLLLAEHYIQARQAVFSELVSIFQNSRVLDTVTQILTTESQKKELGLGIRDSIILYLFWSQKFSNCQPGSDHSSSEVNLTHNASKI